MSGAGKGVGGRGTDVILPTINFLKNEWTGKGGQLETRQVQDPPFSVCSKTHRQIWGTRSPAPGAAADLHADSVKPPPPPGRRRWPSSRSSPGRERNASPGGKTKARGSGSTPPRHSYRHTARRGPAHSRGPPASAPLAPRTGRLTPTHRLLGSARQHTGDGGEHLPHGLRVAAGPATPGTRTATQPSPSLLQAPGAEATP